MHGVGRSVRRCRPNSNRRLSAFVAGRSLMLNPFGPHRYKFATAPCSLQLLTKQFSSVRRSAPETGAKIAIASVAMHVGHVAAARPADAPGKHRPPRPSAPREVANARAARDRRTRCTFLTPCLCFVIGIPTSLRKRSALEHIAPSAAAQEVDTHPDSWRRELTVHHLRPIDLDALLRFSLPTLLLNRIP